MGIFSWLWKGDSADGAQDRETAETVDRIVTLSPHLRLANGYRERLVEVVGSSLEYVHDLVDALPAAHDASAAAWSTDRLIHAFFATPDDIAHALSRPAELRAYFDQNPLADEAYAVLGMTMTERRVLGTVQRGDALVSDVQRTTVSFSDHQVRVCAASEDELRREIVRRVMDQLALEGIGRIESDTTRRETLQHDRALLKARLQLLERQGAGMSGVLGSAASVDFAERARLQAELDENDAKIAELGLQSDALDRQLNVIRDVFAEPASYVFVLKKKLRLNLMNVVVEEGDHEEGAEIEFRMAHIPANPAGMRAFALVRFARADLLPATSMYEAGKRLVL